MGVIKLVAIGIMAGRASGQGNSWLVHGGRSGAINASEDTVHYNLHTFKE